MNIAYHCPRTTSGKLLQFHEHPLVKAEGNLERMRRSKVPLKGILAFKRELLSEKKSIRFSHQSLKRAKFRDEFPSLNAIHQCSKNGSSPNAPTYDRRSTEWNEEQEEFARQKAYKLHKEVFKMKGHLQWCPQNKLLQKLPLCKGEEYRDRLGDTFQRKDVHSWQWGFVTHDGIIFSEWWREEDFSTVKHNSWYPDRQWRCGLRHASTVLHQGASIRDEIWTVIWRTINSSWNIGWVNPNYRERQVKSTSVWTQTPQGIC